MLLKIAAIAGLIAQDFSCTLPHPLLHPLLDRKPSFISDRYRGAMCRAVCFRRWQTTNLSQEIKDPRRNLSRRCAGVAGGSCFIGRELCLRSRLGRGFADTRSPTRSCSTMGNTGGR